MRVSAALALATLLAFSSSVAAEPPDDVLRIGTAGEVRTLDPHVASGPMELRAAEACFEGLVRIDPASFEPVPGLAASWTVSDDGLVWTFALRPDALWSDGAPVTAQQVTASLRRALDPEVDAAYASMLHELRGARAWNVYGAADRALRGSAGDPGLLGRLRAMLRFSPEGTQRIAFRGWPSAHRILPALMDAPEPLVREAFAGRRERWTTEQLVALSEQLERLAVRVGEAHVAARDAFGRTLGVIPSEDGRTVRIELERPQPWLLDVLAIPIAAVVPPAAHLPPADGQPPWWGTEGVPVNGPYRLASASAEADGGHPRIRLRRNERYWDAASVRQDRIDIVGVADPHESLRLFTEGRLDWTTNWPREVTPALTKAPELRISESAVVYYYLLNCTRPALRDVRVRRALATAVDRDALLRASPTLMGRPAATFVPPALPGYAPPEPGLAFDPVGARKLLAEAGFPGGQGLPPIDILFNTSEAHRDVARFVAEQWRAHLGIEVTLRNAAWMQYQETRKQGSFDVSRAGWIADDPEPMTFLGLFEGGRSENDSRWSDARFDALLARARAEPARAARLGLYAEAERLLLTDGVPCIPLYWYRSPDLVQARVRGFRTRTDGASPDRPGAHNGLSRHPLRGLWVERDAK